MRILPDHLTASPTTAGLPSISWTQSRASSSRLQAVAVPCGLKPAAC